MSDPDAGTRSAKRRAAAEGAGAPDGVTGAGAPEGFANAGAPPQTPSPVAYVAAGTAVEPPSPDIAAVEAESGIPGRHRGGFERWPTAPVGVSADVPPVTEPLVQWAPPEPRAPYRGLSGWALGFSIVALIVAMFVGWGFPIGLVGIVTAIIALRRPLESRGVAAWALALGAVSVIYSAGWLWFAASRTDLLG